MGRKCPLGHFRARRAQWGNGRRPLGRSPLGCAAASPGRGPRRAAGGSPLRGPPAGVSPKGPSREASLRRSLRQDPPEGPLREGEAPALRVQIVPLRSHPFNEVRHPSASHGVKEVTGTYRTGSQIVPPRSILWLRGLRPGSIGALVRALGLGLRAQGPLDQGRAARGPNLLHFAERSSAARASALRGSPRSGDPSDPPSLGP